MPLWLQLILAVIVGNTVYDICDGFAREAVNQWRNRRQEEAAMDAATAELRARWDKLCADAGHSEWSVQYDASPIEVFRADQPFPQPLSYFDRTKWRVRKRLGDERYDVRGPSTD